MPDLARLRDTAPSLRTVGGILLHRIYERGGPFPTLWNAFRHVGPLSRFDHHRVAVDGLAAEPRGTLYAAADIPTAVVEFFQTTRQINRTRRQPWLVSVCYQRFGPARRSSLGRPSTYPSERTWSVFILRQTAQIQQWW